MLPINFCSIAFFLFKSYTTDVKFLTTSQKKKFSKKYVLCLISSFPISLMLNFVSDST